MTVRGLLLLLGMAAMTWLASTCGAAVKANPRTQDLQLRKHSPIPLEVELAHTGGGLLQGRLEATIQHRQRRAGIQTSRELVLGNGKQIVSMLLPPPYGTQDGDTLSVNLRWLGKKGDEYLGQFKLGSIGFSSNEVVLCIPRDDRRRSEAEMEREQNLALESLQPGLRAAGFFSFNTLFARIDFQSIPSHPVGWCAYDAAFIDSAAFASMKEKQLQALARWLEAGGTAMVALSDPSAPPFDDRHIAFLNRWTSGGSGAYRLDGPRIAPASAARSATYRAQMGRLVVEHQMLPSAKSYQERPWRLDVARLWALGRSQMNEVETTGNWSSNGGAFSVGWQRGDPDVHSWLWSSAIGYDTVSPDKPRPLPLGLVALLLGALLLAVGPGDWFLLGALRKRRWTWLLLPALCVLAAWSAFMLAGATIGRGDRTGVVTVTDLSEDGRILKVCRMDMVLAAKERTWVTNVGDGMASPFLRFGGQDTEFTNPEPTEVGDLASEWKTATQFEIRRSLRQWTPAMMQSVAFPSGTDSTGIDWGSVISRWKSIDFNMRPITPFQFGEWHFIIAGESAKPYLPPDADASISREAFTHGQIPPSSRMQYFASEFLAGSWRERSWTPNILLHTAPTLSSVSALRTNAAPLVVMAWKEGPHEMHIVRKHYMTLP